MTRHCGKCQLCCELIDVLPIGKLANQRCKFQGTRGCSIYERRPECCKAFVCGWLKGALPNHLRPDKVGAFAWITTMIGTQGATFPIMAVNARATQPLNQELREYALRFSRQIPVTIQRGAWTELYQDGALIARWKHATQFLNLEETGGKLALRKISEQAEVLADPAVAEQWDKAQREAVAVQEKGEWMP